MPNLVWGLRFGLYAYTRQNSSKESVFPPGLAGSRGVADLRPATRDPGRNQRPAPRDPERPGPRPGLARFMTRDPFGPCRPKPGGPGCSFCSLFSYPAQLVVEEPPGLTRPAAALQSCSTHTATLQLKHANLPLPSAASPRRRRSCAASARRAQVGTSLPCDSLSRLNALSLVTSIKFVISRLCKSLQPSEVEVAPYLFALSIIG